MFLTITGLSSFHSLNSCLATIFLSTNISVAPLSKSGFTVMLLYMSTFSILIFSYTSFNILNILPTFFCLPLLLCLSEPLPICYSTVLFSVQSTLPSSSSTMVAFFLSYTLDIKYFFFSPLIFLFYYCIFSLILCIFNLTFYFIISPFPYL